MFSVPLAQLSHENGESLTKKDLSEGADILMDGKTYDVRICEVVLSSPQGLPTIIKIDHNYIYFITKLQTLRLLLIKGRKC